MMAFKNLELTLIALSLIAQCLCGGAFIYGFTRRKHGLECAFLTAVAYGGISFMDLIVAFSSRSGRAPITPRGWVVLFLMPDLLIGLVCLCAYMIPPAALKFFNLMRERRIKKGTSC